MKNSSFDVLFMMAKKLRNGLIFMVIAVFSMPFAVLLKDSHPQATILVLLVSMILELVGLVFVILSILEKRKNQA